MCLEKTQEEIVACFVTVDSCCLWAPMDCPRAIVLNLVHLHSATAPSLIVSSLAMDSRSLAEQEKDIRDLLRRAERTPVKTSALVGPVLSIRTPRLTARITCAYSDETLSNASLISHTPHTLLSKSLLPQTSSSSLRTFLTWKTTQSMPYMIYARTQSPTCASCSPDAELCMLTSCE